MKIGKYMVRVVQRTTRMNLEVICPVCQRRFHIEHWGKVECPGCGSKLDYQPPGEKGSGLRGQYGTRPPDTAPGEKWILS